MKRLEYNTITTNSERSPNLAVPARPASLRNSSRFIFRSAQPGLFTCTFLLLRGRVADHPLSSAFRQPANILKGSTNGNLSSHRKSVDLCGDCGRVRPVRDPRVEELVSGLPCPEFKRIAYITVNLTKWMKFVKIKISRERKNV